MTTPIAFSGIFFDESGQRLLRIASTFVDNSLLDLHNKCLPSNIGKYRGALERISTWEKQIIDDEYNQVKNQYPDVDENLKQNFVSYVKAMRGGHVNTKIMVSIPDASNFFHKFMCNISGNRSVMSGKYHNIGEFDRKVICMDCLRDTLYSFLNDEHVKINTEKIEKEPEEKQVQKEEVQNEFSDNEDKWEVDSDIHPTDSVSQINLNRSEEKPHRALPDKIKEELSNEKTDESKSKVSNLSSIALSNISKSRRAATEVSVPSSHKSQKAKSLISFVSDTKLQKNNSVVSEHKSQLTEKPTPTHSEQVKRSASPGGRSYITQLTCNSDD